MNPIALDSAKICLPGEDPNAPAAARASPSEGPAGPRSMLEDIATPFGAVQRCGLGRALVPRLAPLPHHPALELLASTRHPPAAAGACSPAAAD